MAVGNTTGTLLRFTLFGESHGVAIGGIIDGFPAGFEVNTAFIDEMLAQRSSTTARYETRRKESDEVEFLSGIVNGRTIGSPVAFLIRNKNNRGSDYESLKDVFRPGHADWVYYQKYGIHPQPGGGRASGRETAARVVAGALAIDFLKGQGIEIGSFVSEIAGIHAQVDSTTISVQEVLQSDLYCPDSDASRKMNAFLEKLADENDSAGGVVSTFVRGLPAGLGEPVFAKISSLLAAAALSIPAARGVDFGDGLTASTLLGSEFNDVMHSVNGKTVFATNHSGGIQAGISNGNTLLMRTFFRPPSSIAKVQQTVDLKGNQVQIEVKGRHDVCFVPRAAVVVSSMVALVIMDLFLQKKSYDLGGK
ncbi:MAG: chorismate synthase [Bacteroidetes bacterium HGW-Bacteroidetes-6]|jgi:chorismate synthase|nr:MAG: chorismate synthase [Bacteroidetes bacterium HGW-Bacteroidetes-6]